MHSRELDKRIRALQLKRELRAGCNCRKEQASFYHCLSELEKILSVGCVVHGIRYLAEVSWAPSSMPLAIEDRPLCSCRPSATREWLENERGPLAEEEQVQECLTWEQALSEDPQEQMQVEALLKNYYKRFGRNNEILQR
jgi:hypothetical protein